MGALGVTLTDDALDHLVELSAGDARAALTALEAAVLLADAGETLIDGARVADAVQKRIVAYDRGDSHFDVVSAFIKSMRGSDPDAALFWLGRMIHAGEDPRFIVRRMVIFASEDVGLADPQALPVAVAAAHALEHVGMPEARFNLAEAAAVPRPGAEVQLGDRRAGEGDWQTRTRPTPSPRTCATPTTPAPRSSGTARATSTRTTSKVTTSSSSTDPSGSRTPSTTSRRARAVTSRSSRARARR